MLSINITLAYDEIIKKKMKAMEYKMLDCTNELYEEKLNQLINLPCTKIARERNERRGIQKQEIIKDQLKRLGYL